MDNNILYYNILCFCHWNELFTWKRVNKKFNDMCKLNISKQKKPLIKKIIKKINTIVHLYQGKNGISYFTLNDNDNIDKIKKLLLKNNAFIMMQSENFRKTTNEINIMTEDEIFDIIEQNGIYYHKKYVDNIMKIKIPFNKVIVKYTSNTWYGKLKEWYNVKNKDYTYILPRLNTRKYIKIIEKFMIIDIEALCKNAPITVDDIMFATRGLMVDDSRFIDNFKILKIKKDTLTLEPEIDNFST